MKKNDRKKSIKNKVLREILEEIKASEKCTFPHWQNWLNWKNWSNWGNYWRNWGNW